MTRPPFQRTMFAGQLLTVKEVADYLKIHPSTVYKLLKHGKIPAFKIGADWRFNIEAVDLWRLRKNT